MRRIFGIVITMTLLTAACTTGAVNPGTNPTTTTIGRIGPPATMAFALQPFDACDPLLEYVKEHALEMVGPYGLGDGYWGGGPWMMEDMAMEGDAATTAPASMNPIPSRPMAPGSSQSPREFSTTSM
jgi:hypothetical protein